MRKNTITFQELRDLLLELGFCETLEKTRIRFEHPTTATVLLFRVQGAKEIVHERDLLVVRRQLVDNGLIDSLTLDRFLQKTTA